jgi:hypothetical protein
MKPPPAFTVVSEAEHMCLRRGDASPATVTLCFKKLDAESASLKTENGKTEKERAQTPALQSEGA